MTTPGDDHETETLLDRAGLGDPIARDALLMRHRDRLRALAASHLDPKLRARVDPSDVVQEVLADADRRLGPYLRERPLPFYPWLCQFARDRLIDFRRRHLGAASRSVSREGARGDRVPNHATALWSAGTSPSGRLIRAERRDRVREALALLSDGDRAVLTLRHIDGLSAPDAARALGVGEEAFKSRHRRALERLRAILEGDASGDRP